MEYQIRHKENETYQLVEMNQGVEKIIIEGFLNICESHKRLALMGKKEINKTELV